MLRYFNRRRNCGDTQAQPVDFSSLHASGDVKASVHERGVVLLHVGKGVVFAANQVGAVIWDGIVARTSFDKLSDSISRDFEISRTVAQKDMWTFVAQLEHA